MPINVPRLDTGQEIPLNIGSIAKDYIECIGITQHDQSHINETTWHYNITESIILLREGAHNIKYSRPTDLRSYKCYKLVTSRAFSVVELVTTISVLILLLLHDDVFPITRYDIIGIIQFFPIFLLIVTNSLKIWVMGFRGISRKKYLIVHFVILVSIICEKIATISLKSYNSRFMQTMLPLFLFDSPYLTSSRRFIRQSLKIFPKFLGILILTLLFILIYSLIGFAMFQEVPGDYHFSSLAKSFYSMFVLFTTSNSPDAVMASYHYSRFTFIFYTSFVTLTTFILMNVLLAITFQLYIFEEKVKVKKIVLTQRRCCRAAFDLLVSRRFSEGISPETFSIFMTYYGDKYVLDALSLFALMDSDDKGYLTLQDFYSFYKFIDVNWNKQSFKKHLRFFNFASRFTTVKNSRAYNIVSYVLIFLNSVYLLYESGSPRSKYHHMISPIDVVFTAIFAGESLLCGVVLGPSFYLSSLSNFIDITINALSIISLGGFSHRGLIILRNFAILRCLKILNIFTIHRNLVQIVEKIIERIMSVSLSIFLIYFSLAFIGKQIFGAYDLTNCCKGSPVESAYVVDINSRYPMFYYENNFRTTLSSFVVLFELSVVNNWYITMEGYAITVGEWTRIFFIVFYFYAAIMITMSVAYIMEAFLFVFCRIKEGMDFETTYSIFIDLPSEDSSGTKILSEGFRRTTIEDITEGIYKDDIDRCIENDV